MPVGVTAGKRQTVRNPFGKGGLDAVVVGTRIVRHLVDKTQVGEAGGIRTDGRSKTNLIEGFKPSQSCTVIPDITHLQREVVGEGVGDAEVPIRDVWRVEIRVHRLDGARAAGGASGCAARKNTWTTSGRIPSDLSWLEKDGAESDCAARGLTSR